MPERKESKSKHEGGKEPFKEPFTTIDDLARQAEELVSGLRKLQKYKHPLEIRKGASLWEGVSEVPDEENSKTLRAGAKTYFFDLKETREGEPYLTITESRFKGEEEERERSTIIVFSEQAEEFAAAVVAMTQKLS